MARIRGKWVGQVVVDMHANINADEIDFNSEIQQELKEEYSKMIVEMLEVMNVTLQRGAKLSVTVTQLHADLYRDDPSEWTKEEAK